MYNFFNIKNDKLVNSPSQYRLKFSEKIFSLAGNPAKKIQAN